MDSFHVYGIYEIRDRGTVYEVKVPETMKNDDIVARYIGKEVELWVMLESAPRIRKVIGVELWAIQEISAGAPMGLLTAETTGDST